MQMRRKVTEMKTGINEVVKQLKSANNIALFCHINPDCDTICSALALKFALQKMNKKIDVFCDGDINGDIADVYGASFINEATGERYDTAVSIDCGDQGRVGKYYHSIFKKAPVTMCIDHHQQYESFTMINYVDPHSGATAELIYLIIKEINKDLIDREIATLLYTALVTDTGNFSFSNTGVRTLFIASDLLSYQINNADISYHFFKEIGLRKFRLKVRGLAKAEFFENDAIGIISFSAEDFKETGTSSADSSNLVNEIVNISTVRIAVSITEVHPHSYKVSIRTKEGVNAGKIANIFGGGGHKNAAGFMLNGFFGNVLDDILKACRDHL